MSVVSKLFRHRHRWKAVSSVSDLQAGVFTVTAWCRCNEIEVKVLAAPRPEEAPGVNLQAVPESAPESE